MPEFEYRTTITAASQEEADQKAAYLSQLNDINIVGSPLPPTYSPTKNTRKLLTDREPRDTRRRLLTISGYKVRELRDHLNLSQGELAKLAAPMTRGYVSVIEAKHTTRVSQSKAERLAKGLQTTVTDLVEFKPLHTRTAPLN